MNYTRSCYNALGGNYECKGVHPYKQLYIYNPTKSVLKKGMRCSTWASDGLNTKKEGSGEVIADIRGDEVLLGCYLGGTAETWVWAPISRLKVVWYIGSLERVIALTKELSAQFEKALLELA